MVFAIGMSQLSAHEYVITPQESPVQCTLDTLTEKEALRYLQSEANHSFKSAAKYDYLIVKVTVENNSADSIILEKDEYLEGLEDYLSFRTDVKELYKTIIDENSLGFWVCLAAAGIFTPAAVACGVVAYYEHPPLLLFEICLVPLSLLGIIGSVASWKQKRKAAQKLNKISHPTLIKKQQNKKRFSSAVDRYVVPAHTTFHDILFLQLSKTKRDFFNHVTPKLYYTIKP